MNPSAAIDSIKPDARGVRSIEVRALGTSCKLQFIMPDEQAALRFLADALTWLETFEKKYSRFSPSSEISRINEAAGKEWVKVDRHMEHIFDLIDNLHRMTDGILDPSMLPLLKVWDWKTVHRQLPAAGLIESARKLTGWTMVRRKPGAVFLPKRGMGLDFGGFGKEFAVDHIARIAHQHGVTNGLIDLGQDIFAMGGNGTQPFWHVGVQHGRDPEKSMGSLAVSNFAVSSSGDYARCFEHDGIRYGHILDPRSGWPVSNGTRLVTALAPSCLQAGVISTAAFVLGRKDGLSFVSQGQNVEVCIQDERGVEKTPGFMSRQVSAA